MDMKITYGTTIHSDGTIAKYEIWKFETAEEFWTHYDLHAGNEISADLQDFTISKRTYITVEEYRQTTNPIEA